MMLTDSEETRGAVLGANALPRGNRGTPWNKAPNDCDHPPSAIQKRGNTAMFYERCELCGNRWKRIPLTMMARDPKTTGRDRTPILSTRTREQQQNLYWESSACTTKSGLILDGCDVRLVDRGSFEGVDTNMVLIGEDETACL